MKGALAAIKALDPDPAPGHSFSILQEQPNHQQPTLVVPEVNSLEDLEEFVASSEPNEEIVGTTLPRSQEILDAPGLSRTLLIYSEDGEKIGSSSEAIGLLSTGLWHASRRERKALFSVLPRLHDMALRKIMAYANPDKNPDTIQSSLLDKPESRQDRGEVAKIGQSFSSQRHEREPMLEFNCRA